MELKSLFCGSSLAVQLLRHCVSTAGSMDSIPSWETKVLHAVPGGQKNRRGKVTIL